MEEKNLVLITSTFPFGKRESYLENEIGCLAASFRKIHILVHSKTASEKRPLPPNCTVTEIHPSVHASLLSVFSLSDLFSELLYILRTLSPFNWVAGLRTFAFAINQALGIYPLLAKITREQEAGDQNTLFYCYWLDYYALSLALAKKNKLIHKAVSRAHNWDVYFNLHKGNYLPFRRLLAANLDAIYAISDNARNHILAKTGPGYENKVKVARLGTQNTSQKTNPPATDDTITLVSCSTLIKRKRIDKIIESIAALGEQIKVAWYHIGEEGDQKQYLLDLIKNKSTPAKKMALMGHVENNKILELYTNKHIDLFINLSESEGVPVSIMEAYSAGIPAIATNVGGVAEVINASNGYLIEPDFTELAVQKIEEYASLSDDAKQQFRTNAYNTWNTLYNAQKNYTEFAENLSQL